MRTKTKPIDLIRTKGFIRAYLLGILASVIFNLITGLSWLAGAVIALMLILLAYYHLETYKKAKDMLSYNIVIIATVVMLGFIFAPIFIFLMGREKKLGWYIPLLVMLTIILFLLGLIIGFASVI